MTRAQKIRILIADDHQLVRFGLATMLATVEDFEVVAEAENGEQAMALCEKHQPDTILMDLNMPHVNGTEAISRIKEAYPDINIIALTGFGSADLIMAALSVGATGYLLKNIGADVLIDAIRNVNKGHTILGPEITKTLVSKKNSIWKQTDYDLTERELEILAMLADGLTNPKIAEELNLSVSTIKTHVSNILSKLHVSTRGEAVKLATDKNLLTNANDQD